MLTRRQRWTQTAIIVITLLVGNIIVQVHFDSRHQAAMRKTCEWLQGLGSKLPDDCAGLQQPHGWP